MTEQSKLNGIAAMMEKPIGIVRDPLKQGARNHSIIVNLDFDLVKDNPEFQYSSDLKSVYIAPSQAQLQAAIDQAREEAAEKAMKLTWLDHEDRMYLRSQILALIGKPLGEKS